VLLLVIGILELFSTQDGRILGRILIAVGLAIFFQVYIFQSMPYLTPTIFAIAPFLLLHLLYSALAFFVTSTKTFDPLQGSMAAQVLLSVVPENVGI
jgi:hypothetical protein